MTVLHHESTTAALGANLATFARTEFRSLTGMHELGRMPRFTLDDVINSAKAIARQREYAAVARSEEIARELESARLALANDDTPAARRKLRALQYEAYKTTIESQGRHPNAEAETQFYRDRIAEAKHLLAQRPPVKIREALKTDVAHFTFLLSLK